MRNRGLRKVNSQFDVGSAQADVFAYGARATLLQRLQNASAGGVGDGMQETVELLL